MTDVSCVLDVRAALGEGPTWNREERRLYWVNINGHTVNRYDPATGANEVCQLPEQVGSFVLREAGGLVVALRSGFHFLDFDTAALTPIADPEADKPDNRFNDGRCGPDGRFWAGTMRDPQDPAQRTGALYCLDTDLSWRTMVSDIGVSNGLAFSPDGGTMYHADTQQQTIWAFDFRAEDGTLSNRRVFATTHDLPGRPDGGCVDAEGVLLVGERQRLADGAFRAGRQRGPYREAAGSEADHAGLRGRQSGDHVHHQYWLRRQHPSGARTAAGRQHFRL